LEAVDHAGKRKSGKPHNGHKSFLHFGELRLQGVVELNCDWIRGLLKVAALGLRGVQAHHPEVFTLIEGAPMYATPNSDGKDQWRSDRGMNLPKRKRLSGAGLMVLSPQYARCGQWRCPGDGILLAE